MPNQPGSSGLSIGSWLTGVAFVLLVITLVMWIIKPWSITGGWSQGIMLVIVVLAALSFDFVNGMNDAANAIATVISTRVLTPTTALIMAAILNFAGAVVFEGVAKGIANKIIDIHLLSPTMPMILCGLLGAIGWSWTMAKIGLPISMSHALIGGLLGVFVVVNSAALKLAYIGEIALWMMLAPLLGFVVGWALMIGIMWAFKRMAPHKINRHFRIWQIFSSGLMAFSHGGNDAQKAMGIITMALVAGGLLTSGPDGAAIPLWVKVACASMIAFGTGLGGRRVIHTLGHRMIRLQPVHGFAAETVAAGTITLATALNIPVSTTHVISSSIMGVGASKRLSAVRWGVAGNIVSAWVLTIPTCGLVSAGLYALLRVFHLQ